MSILSDPEFLIHQLRINYLRRIDDPAGDRIINFNHDDISRSPYILMSNVDSQEIQYCHSPHITMIESTSGRGGGGIPVDSSSGNALTMARMRKVAQERQRQGLAPSVINSAIDPSEMSDDDFELENQFNNKMFSKVNLNGAPAVMITMANEQENNSTTSDDDDEEEEEDDDEDDDEDDEEEEEMKRFHQQPLIFLAPERNRLSKSPPPKLPLSSEEEAILLPGKQDIFQGKSGLTNLIEETRSKVENPFAENFGVFRLTKGFDKRNSITLKVFFPFSQDPIIPIKIPINKDATVQEALGLALYIYVDEKRQPKLDPNKSKVANWNMRIAEEDGEVDDDFPALDRMRKVAGYGAGELAIVEANSTERKINEEIDLRPRAKSQDNSTQSALSNTLVPPVPIPPINYASLASASVSSPITVSATSGTKTSAGLQVFLRIRMNPNNQVSTTTVIAVTSDMYIADVLGVICKRRQLDPEDWVLMIPERNNFVVPLDRTVESLEGLQELRLMRRSAIPNNLVIGLSNPSPAPSPNAGLFTYTKRLSEVAQPKYVSSNDIISSYRKYKVNRKMPISVGKHERVLAIDGDYIQILPSDSKAYENSKTSSFRVTSIVEIKQSARAPLNFKIWVDRGREVKRYDFEGQNEKETSEIIQKINDLRELYRASDKLNNHPIAQSSTPSRRRLLVL